MPDSVKECPLDGCGSESRPFVLHCKIQTLVWCQLFPTNLTIGRNGDSIWKMLIMPWQHTRKHELPEQVMKLKNTKLHASHRFFFHGTTLWNNVFLSSMGVKLVIPALDESAESAAGRDTQAVARHTCQCHTLQKNAEYGHNQTLDIFLCQTSKHHF